MCVTPGCENQKILARGLCGPCYHRMRRNGSVERKYVVNTGICSVEGCGKPSLAKNLCEWHYLKQQHPLTQTWKNLRTKSPGQFPPGWARFDVFLSEVGERPSPKHQLRRIDPKAPWGVSNVKWLAPIGRSTQRLTVEAQAAYGREWALQRRFKITGAEYERMFQEQNGVCAICGKKERRMSRSGKEKFLAVDHDHKTGDVRGLLCSECNQGIGRLQDDPTLLRAAADYIDRHRSPNLACDSGETS